MPQVSSLHLGSVSTSSRGLFPPPPSLSSGESSPEEVLGAVLCWSIMVHHHAGSTTVLTPEEPRASHRNLSPALSFFLTVFFSLYSCFWLFSFSPHTSVHTWSNNASLLLPCPPAILVRLSGNRLTLPRPHNTTLEISKIHTQCKW